MSKKYLNIVKVVYTKEKETADSYIERSVYEATKYYGREVYVVTSDGAEQSLILGAGAYRISANELWRRINIAKKIFAMNIQVSMYCH